MKSPGKKSAASGFVLIEVMLSLALFTVVVMGANTLFTMSQRTYTAGANQGELSQNARVVLDRISRELRQSQILATALASTSASASSELYFQDGHNLSQITYIRYQLSGHNILRIHEAYYFAADPSVYVAWNSKDAFNNPPSKIILDASDNIVGEYVEALRFWQTDDVINIEMDLQKNSKTTKFATSVYSRNQ